MDYDYPYSYLDEYNPVKVKAIDEFVTEFVNEQTGKKAVVFECDNSVLVFIGNTALLPDIKVFNVNDVEDAKTYAYNYVD